MDDNIYTQGFLNPSASLPVLDDEGIGEPVDALTLEVDETALVKVIDKRVEKARQYYTDNYNLYERRRKNEVYLFGKQISELEKNNQLKDYEAKNLDNVLYEIESTIKPLAMSQLPDLLVTPGNNTDQSKEIAQLLTTAVDSDVKKRQNREVLAMAFKHRSVYFVGVIKCRWNAELCGGLGDYEFIYVHPDTVDFDHLATEPDATKMSWIAQLVNTSVEKVLREFPKAKVKFLDQLRKEGIMAKDRQEPEWGDLATAVDIREVWFTDYVSNGEGKWEKVEGVCWKYKECILGKMKNPNFDYEGKTQVFTYDDPRIVSSKRPVSMEEMQSSLTTGVFPPFLKKEKYFNNFFDEPRKPYYFVTYDQWGKQPLDETTALEQNIRNQNTLDKRGKQIEETLNNRGHHIWSKLGGFKPSDVQKMDHNNPNEDYLVNGMPSQVHEFVAPDRPTQQEFADLDRTRQRMYEVSGSQAVRGDIQSDVATTNQIAREANYTRADDLVDETINPASEWMAGWALQMIKTRYTQDHMRKLFGKKGELIFVKLNQNLIEEGMEVSIKSSGTDKIRKQNNAMNMGKMQLTDPLSFFEDMGMDDPEGRAAKLITFKTDMPLYVSMFVENGPTSTPELIEKLQSITANAGPQPGTMGGATPPQQAQGQPAIAPPVMAPPTGAPQGSVRAL